MPSFGGLWGKLNPLEVLDALEPSGDTSLHETASFDVEIVKIGRAVFAEYGDVE
jgi:hypothetical protein